MELDREADGLIEQFESDGGAENLQILERPVGNAHSKGMRQRRKGFPGQDDRRELGPRERNIFQDAGALVKEFSVRQEPTRTGRGTLRRLDRNGLWEDMPSSRRDGIGGRRRSRFHWRFKEGTRGNAAP